MSLNQINLIGRVGNVPEMRYTPEGTAVTNFSMAVNNDRRGDNGEWVEDTEWFGISAWDRLAETVNQYVEKGSRVFVEGRFSTRQYTNNSGEARTSLEVRAFKVIFLDSASPSVIDTVDKPNPETPPWRRPGPQRRKRPKREIPYLPDVDFE